MNRKSFIANALMSLAMYMLPKTLLPAVMDFQESKPPQDYVKDEPKKLYKGAMAVMKEGSLYETPYFIIGNQIDFQFEYSKP